MQLIATLAKVANGIRLQSTPPALIVSLFYAYLPTVTSKKSAAHWDSQLAWGERELLQCKLKLANKLQINKSEWSSVCGFVLGCDWAGFAHCWMGLHRDGGGWGMLRLTHTRLPVLFSFLWASQTNRCKQGAVVAPAFSVRLRVWFPNWIEQLEQVFGWFIPQDTS